MGGDTLRKKELCTGQGVESAGLLPPFLSWWWWEAERPVLQVSNTCPESLVQAAEDPIESVA